MANIENLKPFTKDNAKEYGKRGGIASGKVRRLKAYKRKRLIAYFNLQNYINSLSDTEYKEFLQDYTPTEQNYINNTFRKTEAELKEMVKNFKK